MSNIAYSDWKINFKKTPDKSYVSIVSLYDLYYNNNTENYDSDGILTQLPDTWFNAETNEATGGCTLSHDIICLNMGSSETSLYEQGGIINPTYESNSFDDELSPLGTFSIEIARPIVNIANQPYTVFINGSPYNIYTKSSIVNFASISEFRDNSFNSSSSNTTLDLPILSTSSSTADILLANEESTLTSHYEITEYKAFTKLCITSNFLKKILTELYGIADLNVSGINIEASLGAGTSDIKNNILPGSKISNTLHAKIANLVWLLKNTFVAVRAPFFGDYISQDGFNQNLNQSSHVIHNELILSDKGDFDSANTEFLTPYLPHTSPTIDMITTGYADSVKDIEDENLLDKDYNLVKYKTGADGNKVQAVDIKKLTIAASFDTTPFKGLPIPASTINNGLSYTFTPINYFNANTSYSSYNNLLPTVLPKSGNAFISGRIISPTIDEIWYMLKKIVAGRDADLNEDDERTKLEVSKPIGSGEHFNDKDSKLVESASDMSEYLDKGKLKDPLLIRYPKAAGESVEIVKYVNQNNKIRYSIYDALKRVSVLVTNDEGQQRIKLFDFLKSQDELDDLGEDMSKLYNQPLIYNEEFEAQRVGVDENGYDVYEYDVEESSYDFNPRNAPMSLRELEALAKGNKLNLEMYAKYIYWYLENFMPSVGDRENVHRSKSATNNYHGGLNQFHVYFAPNSGGPLNGAFDRDGTFDIDNVPTDGGVPALFRDTTNLQTVYESISGDTQDYPSIRDYGGDSSLSTRQEQYSSKQVFMGADGHWHYLFENMRVPIMKSDY